MRLWTSILAGLQVLSGGTVLLELWDSRYVGLFVLVVAAMQAGTVMYMKGSQPGLTRAPSVHRARHLQKHSESKSEAPIWPRPYED